MFATPETLLVMRAALALSEAKSIVALACVPGLGAFMLERAGTRRFRKQVLRVWKGTDPNTGQELDFDRAFLERLAKNTNRWLALGHRVGAPDGHTDSALANAGFWLAFAVAGDELFGLYEAPDDATAAKIGTSIRDVSVFVRGPEQASNGEVFDAVILHCCLTPAPVLPGQPNFIRLSRSSPMADKKTQPDPNAETPPGDGAAPPTMSPDQAKSVLSVLMGLDATVDWDQIVKTARERCMGTPGAELVGGVPSAAYLALSKKAQAEAIAAALAPLKLELEKTRRKAAEDRVRDAKLRAAEAGSPLEPDTEKRIVEALARGDDDSRAVGELLLKLAVPRGEQKLLYATKQEASSTSDEVKKFLEESNKAASQMLLARGIKHEAKK